MIIKLKQYFIGLINLSVIMMIVQIVIIVMREEVSLIMIGEIK